MMAIIIIHQKVKNRGTKVLKYQKIKMIYNNNIKILNTRSWRKIHQNYTLKSLVIFIVIIIQKWFNFLLLEVIFLIIQNYYLIIINVLWCITKLVIVQKRRISLIQCCWNVLSKLILTNLYTQRTSIKFSFHCTSFWCIDGIFI